MRRYTWGRLPYRLSFSMRTTVVKSPYLLEGVAHGQLEGMGRWTLNRKATTRAVRLAGIHLTCLDECWRLSGPVFGGTTAVMAEGPGAGRYLGVRQIET